MVSIDYNCWISHMTILASHTQVLLMIFSSPWNFMHAQDTTNLWAWHSSTPVVQFHPIPCSPPVVHSTEFTFPIVSCDNIVDFLRYSHTGYRIMSILRTHQNSEINGKGSWDRLSTFTMITGARSWHASIISLHRHVTILILSHVNVITPRYIRQCDNIAVCTPFITPDLGAMFGELLVERLKCSSISLCYNLHHSECWFVGGIYKTEHPHKICWTPWWC